MTPPGLTCCGCTHPLYPSLARLTSEGWLHVDCAAMDTCQTCAAPMIAQGPWARFTPSQRGTAVNDGYRRKADVGICHRCYERDRKGEKGRLRKAEDARVRTERLEDLHWMAEHGECLEGAAARLGITVGAVEKFLTRFDPELLRTLSLRNPRDWNRWTSGDNLPTARTRQQVEARNIKRSERRRAARRRESVAA